MGNNMLIAVEAKADYVSAILKVANSALPSKLRYLSAVSRDTRRTGDEWRWQVGRSMPSSWGPCRGGYSGSTPASPAHRTPPSICSPSCFRCRTRSSCSSRELPPHLPRRDQTATVCTPGCSQPFAQPASISAARHSAVVLFCCS